MTAYDEPHPDFATLEDFLSAADKRLAEAEILLADLDDRQVSAAIDPLRRRIEEVLAYKRLPDEVPLLYGFCTRFTAALTEIRSTEALSALRLGLIEDLIHLLRRVVVCARLRLAGWFSPEAFRDFLADVFNRHLAALRADKADDPAVSLRPLRVLIADDEEMIRTFLAELLEQTGHPVMAVSNGAEAIGLMQTGLFDLVFSDIKMPGASGIDVLRHARESDFDIAVVLVTGYASVDNAVDAVRLGAYDYLTKPFEDTDEIRRVVLRAEEQIDLARRNRILLHALQQKNAELARYSRGLEQALASLTEKNRALIHADRMATLGTLVAGVAHEINNPTTFIRGNLQTLEKFWQTLAPHLGSLESAEGLSGSALSFIREETPALLKDMLAGTERITKITSGLRAFVHHQKSQEMREVDLAAVLRDALQLVQNRFKYDIDLVAEIGELPPVRGDAQELTQVFVNLLVNAADAVERRAEARVTVRAAADADCITVAVGDNGPGIPEKIRDKVFDPFFTTKGVDRGTGLGLSILQGIVRRHDSGIGFETSSAGTVFTFRMPLKAVSAEKDGVPRVLIFEDDEAQGNLLLASLRAAGGCEAELVRNGREGLARVVADPPALIALDMLLPDMDGVEILRRLRRDADPAVRDVPAVVVTGLKSPGLLENLEDLGVDRIFHKPYSIAVLLAHIERVLASRPARARRTEPQPAGGGSV